MERSTQVWCQNHHVRPPPVPALCRLGRLLLLELSRTSTMVGAAFSEAAGCAVVTVVAAVLLAGTPVVVVLLLVVLGAAAGWSAVASMVSRTSSDPSSSDWFSVSWWSVNPFTGWSERNKVQMRKKTHLLHRIARHRCAHSLSVSKAAGQSVRRACALHKGSMSAHAWDLGDCGKCFSAFVRVPAHH